VGDTRMSGVIIFPVMASGRSGVSDSTRPSSLKYHVAACLISLLTLQFKWLLLTMLAARSPRIEIELGAVDNHTGPAGHKFGRLSSVQVASRSSVECHSINPLSMTRPTCTAQLNIARRPRRVAQRDSLTCSGRKSCVALWRRENSVEAPGTTLLQSALTSTQQSAVSL
jgi:hypothetical protein